MDLFCVFCLPSVLLRTLLAEVTDTDEPGNFSGLAVYVLSCKIQSVSQRGWSAPYSHSGPSCGSATPNMWSIFLCHRIPNTLQCNFPPRGKFESAPIHSFINSTDVFEAYFLPGTRFTRPEGSLAPAIIQGVTGVPKSPLLRAQFFLLPSPSFVHSLGALRRCDLTDETLRTAPGRRRRPRPLTGIDPNP